MSDEAEDADDDCCPPVTPKRLTVTDSKRRMSVCKVKMRCAASTCLCMDQAGLTANAHRREDSTNTAQPLTSPLVEHVQGRMRDEVEAQVVALGDVRLEEEELVLIWWT